MSTITDGYILTITGWTNRSLEVRVDSTSQSELTDSGGSFKVTFGPREALLNAAFMPMMDIAGLMGTLSDTHDEPEFVGIKFWGTTLEEIEEEAYQAFMIKLRADLPADASVDQLEEIEKIGREAAHSLVTKVRAQEAYNAAIKAGEAETVEAAPAS